MVVAFSESVEDSPAPWADTIDEGIMTLLSVSHFVSLKTKKFFDVMQIETDILEQDPVWLDNNGHYITLCNKFFFVPGYKSVFS